MLIALLALGCGNKGVGDWERGPKLLDQREQSPGFLLDDGRVLLVGGHFDNETNQPLDTSEIVDVEAGTSTFTASFQVSRTTNGPGPVVQLADGRVLCGSPFNDPSQEPITSEVWDPATGEWTVSGAQSRGTGEAVALPDGRALVAGGIDWSTNEILSRAEIWDGATDGWVETGAMAVARTGHEVVYTSDAVVAIGGFDVYPDGAGVASSEVWDPDTGAWGELTPMTKARGNAAAVVLTDGRVLVAGGTASSGGYQEPLVTAEIYDPVAGAWSVAASMNEPRTGHTLTLLESGRVLAAGGTDDAKWEGSKSTEIYDPEADTWIEAASMRWTRQGFAAVLLPDGRVLAAGGWVDGLYNSEVYTAGD